MQVGTYFSRRNFTSKHTAKMENLRTKITFNEQSRQKKNGNGKALNNTNYGLRFSYESCLLNIVYRDMHGIKRIGFEKKPDTCGLK